MPSALDEFRIPAAQAPAGPERTTLNPTEEAAFKTWISQNKITDLDHPNSHYDYRGYWKEAGNKPVRFGVDHFPDTYKQHGHPTFSVESKYSKGPGDGGTWKGETFVPSKGSALDEFRRKPGSYTPNTTTASTESGMTPAEQQTATIGKVAGHILDPLISTNPFKDAGRNSSSKAGQVAGAFAENFGQGVLDMTSPLNLATAGLISRVGPTLRYLSSPRVAPAAVDAATTAAEAVAKPRLVKNPMTMTDVLNEVRTAPPEPPRAVSLPPEPQLPRGYEQKIQGMAVKGDASRRAELIAAGRRLLEKKVNSGGKLVPKDEQSLTDILNEIRQMGPDPAAAVTMPPVAEPVPVTASGAESAARQVRQGLKTKADLEAELASLPKPPPPAPKGVPRETTPAPSFPETAAASPAARPPAITAPLVETPPATAPVPRGASAAAPVESAPLRPAGPAAATGPAEPATFYKVVGHDTDVRVDKLMESGNFDEAANEIERGLHKFLFSEKGAVNPKFIAAVGGAGIGGLIGGSVGETPMERGLNAAGGAAMGTMVLPAIAAAFTIGVPKALESYLYEATLSSPSSPLKAYLGAVGGTADAIATKAIAEPAVAAKMLKTLFSPVTIKAFTKAMRHGSSGGFTAGTNAPTVLTKIFGAMDAAMRPALSAGKISADDAARLMLSGEPTTKMGRDTVAFFNKYFAARVVGSLFPRVGVQVLERGIERTPLALLPGMKSVSTASSGFEKAVRALVIGPAAGVAGYMASDRLPAGAKPYVAAAAGPGALPMGVGMALGAVPGSWKDKILKAKVIPEITQNVPAPQFGPQDAIRNMMSGAPMVPNMTRDFARAADPYERDTASGLPLPFGSNLGRTMEKLPGFREKLRVQKAGASIAGKPNQNRDSPLTRFMTPGNPQNDRFKDIPKAVADEITRLDIKVDVPEFKRTVKIGRKEVDVPPDAAEKARAERRQFLIPRLEKLMASPKYQRATDEKKRIYFNHVKQQAEQAGSSKAKATLTKLLRRPHGSQ